MLRDPRLSDEALLRLAAWRLTHGPRPVPDWRQCEGLSSLLAAAKALPRRDPWTLPDLDEPTTGMGLLLRQARQRQQERGA